MNKQYDKYLTLFESSPKKAYRYYLITDHWKEIKKATIIIYKGTCNKTGCYNNIDNSEMHVHHKNYSCLFNEKVNTGIDVELLCKGCHSAEHGFLNIPDKPVKLRKPKKHRKRKKKMTPKQQFKKDLAKWKKKWN